MLDRWLLDPQVTHLNHGTVGATPRRVLAAQQTLRDEMERSPAHFMLRELAGSLAGEPRTAESRMRRAAREVASFVGARGEDLVFTDNTTSAINAVLRSFDLRAGDEILLFEHCYGAIRLSAEYVARGVGATVRCIALPLPGTSEDGVVRALEAAIGPRTRLAILDHITSPSALLLPIAQLAAVCKKRGVPVLVDGAHAPGAIALDVPALGVDWYAGNLHKWCWAPRSSAMLWVDPAQQARLHAPIISWGLDKGMTAEFDWVGTRDPTPHLCAPVAIACLQELGVERVYRYNHELAWQAGQLLAAAWKTALPAPENMVGTMVCVRLPDGAGASQQRANQLRDALWFDERIEVALHALHGALWVRASAQIYTELADIERLAQAVLARV